MTGREWVIGEGELPQVAREVLAHEHSVERSGASVLALSGDLGSGKTAFTQAIAQILAIEEDVTSPTFVIEKAYDIRDERWKTLLHIDAYRIERDEELKVLGLLEALKDPQMLIVIEWAERVSGILPKDASKLFFSHTEDGKRKIRYEPAHNHA